MRIKKNSILHGMVRVAPIGQLVLRVKNINAHESHFKFQGKFIVDINDFWSHYNTLANISDIFVF